MADGAPSHSHTPYYCEENVYQLVTSLIAEHEVSLGSSPSDSVWAAFVTNASRRCLLFHQKAAPPDRAYVIWDYHVFAVVARHKRPGGTPELSVMDLDSTLGLDVPLKEYIEDTFQPNLYRPGGTAETLLGLEAPIFRIVPARDFLAYFASDRSHMLAGNDDGDQDSAGNTQAATAVGEQCQARYVAPPPSWPLIASPQAASHGATNNLWSRYLDVGADERARASGEDGAERAYEEWENGGAIYGHAVKLEGLAGFFEGATQGAQS